MLQKSFRVFAIPLFQDNYSYIVQTSHKQSLFLVDPANPSVIMECLEKYFSTYNVGHILYTHKHWDHAGGSEKLFETLNKKQEQNKVEVFSGIEDSKQIKIVTRVFENDEEVPIGQTKIKVLKVPCHTRGHVIYHLYQKEQANNIEEWKGEKDMITSEGKKIRIFEQPQCVFTGDTLFQGAVGKFFQGNAKEMFDNLLKINKSFRKNCSLFNGHQYTLQALKWGLSVEPNNQKIKDLITKLQSQDQETLCTLPTNLENQREINVFVRAVVLGSNDLGVSGVQYLKILREAKDKGSSNLKEFLAKI